VCEPGTDGEPIRTSLDATSYYPAMPSDTVLKLMNTTHRILIAVTGGRAGRSFSGMPVLELTTTGRKSGKLRSTMLTSPYQEGDRTYIVASRGGDDHNPAWFVNLQANPEVAVSIEGRPTQKMRAEVADADERARVWPLIASKHTNYAGYQRKTQREIPVVILSPERAESS
jgi:deazaflavin-dependent oxidoreductase (nitroreductase family)